MTEIICNDARTIASIAVAATETRTLNGHPFVVLADGQQVESIAHMLPQPQRKQGHTVIQDEKGFIKFFKRHQNPQANIYADRGKGSFKAVFNDDTDTETGWKDHTATYPVIKSNNWKAWAEKDGVKMSQAEFAQFIEQNIVDIVEPNHTDMMEISRTLEAKKSASFSSAIRLSNGSHQFAYEESIRGTASNGRLEIPETFKLGLQVFLNGEHYEVSARLRYRINKENHLEMWYELIRPHDIYEDAFNGMFENIEKETGAEIISVSF